MYPPSDKPLLILVAGHSGSGLGTTIHTLEDIGIRCVDNLPLDLLIPVFDVLAKDKQYSSFGFGLHIKSSEEVERFAKIKKEMEGKANIDTIFLTCDDEVLADRYVTSRRRHPFNKQGEELINSIKEEKRLLEGIEQHADWLIDTSTFSPYTLKRFIEDRYRFDLQPRSLHITITSFGFKHGVARPIDSLFDVRFLNNPYFLPSLREKTGKDKDVADFLLANTETTEFLKRLIDWHLWVIPRYYRESKHYFRVGIGCTGGQHRSVFIAEELAKGVKESKLENIVVTAIHRDLKL